MTNSIFVIDKPKVIIIVGVLMLLALMLLPILFVPFMVWGMTGMIVLRPRFQYIDKKKSEHSHHFFLWVLFSLAWPLTKALRNPSSPKYLFMHIETEVENALIGTVLCLVLWSVLSG